MCVPAPLPTNLAQCNQQAIKEIIGPSEDIPAPDMNTDSRVRAFRGLAGG
jgi:glutamate dehydrogenase/leucine dehydrogenase